MIHIDTTEKVLSSRPGFNLHLLNASQRSCLTRFTKEGVLDMSNKKPYRTKAQKAAARKDAFEANGTHYSSAPRSFHKKANG